MNKPQRDIRSGHPADRQSRWSRALGVSAALLGALLAKLSCPACWSAYAALLGSVGVAGLSSMPFFLPLTLLSLVAVLISLGWRATKRRGYGPLLLGSLGAAVIVLGNFVYPAGSVQNSGVALLIGASIWNSWPRRLSSYTG
ncbi:MerC domain-containing protein [Geothermobacter hydrogeniphilus]|uniref:MerC domain-containing protein n=1 Tax=Geothermobacter hydrogeniphilus TaxID=1969733 RepID=UPI00111C1BA3|nr:MerC domain-containing protein [Geothermobacter hydrogeniphilus]